MSCDHVAILDISAILARVTGEQPPIVLAGIGLGALGDAAGASVAVPDVEEDASGRVIFPPSFVERLACRAGRCGSW